jgi:PRTRC genetic system protein C
MIKVKIEDTELEFPETDDDTLKAQLTPFYPSIATAEVKRETKAGVTTVTFRKKVGTKG